MARPEMPDRWPRVVIVGGGIRRPERRAVAAACAGAGDRDRSPEPSPVPALALPGGDGGAEPERHRLADPPHPPGPEERRGRAGRGHGRSTSRRRPSSSTDGVRPLRLPDRGDRRDAFVLRPRRLGARSRPGLKSIERRARDPPPGALRLRGRRARARPRPPPRLADVRDRRRRADGGRAGRCAGRDRPARAWRKDFRHIDPTQARVILLEGTPRVLPAYVRELSEKARAAARRPGRRGPDGPDGDRDRRRGASTSAPSGSRRTRCSGRPGSRPRRWRGRWTCRSTAPGRVLVEPDLTIPGHPEVFVIGDLASLEPGRPARPRRRPGRDPGGPAHRREHRADASGPASAAVPLPRQGLARHDRPRGGRRRPGPRQALGLDRLAGLALHPHPLPDRVPQPVRRPRSSGPGRTSPTTGAPG